MSHIIVGVILSLFLICLPCPAPAHTINYQVENRGISVRVFFDKNDPVNYSAYEILGPGDTIPYQKGRTDRNGFVSFFPDRRGTWIIKVYGESEHGMHGATINVQVDKDLAMSSFDKPLVAKYTKAFVGASFLLALFGGWSLMETRRDSKRNMLNQTVQKTE